MRSLIQSLTPDDSQISWRRVGGMYVRDVRQTTKATTVATDAKTRSIAQFAAND